MLKWLRSIFMVEDRLSEQKKTNALLEQLVKELKRNSDLVEAYNKAYHIR